MEAWDLRREIYRHFADTGRAPSREHLHGWAGGADAAGAMLRELHERHALVLDEAGDIRMALPFSANPTGHRVTGVASGTWWANCAWDALAIPAALGIDARIEATWLDTGEPVELTIGNGDLRSDEGFVHFAIPAARWWDDIVET